MYSRKNELVVLNFYCSEIGSDPKTRIMERVDEMGEVFCSHYVQVSLEPSCSSICPDILIYNVDKSMILMHQYLIEF